MDVRELADNNLFHIISKCYITTKRPDISEIFVVYDNGVRERIWTFSPMRYVFDYREFIGKSKIEAVFYCDRKKPKSIQMR